MEKVDQPEKVGKARVVCCVAVRCIRRHSKSGEVDEDNAGELAMKVTLTGQVAHTIEFTLQIRQGWAPCNLHDKHNTKAVDHIMCSSVNVDRNINNEIYVAKVL